jgi:Ser/Thr protein kinase RdoA (MazF antagonist)
MSGAEVEDAAVTEDPQDTVVEDPQVPAVEDPQVPGLRLLAAEVLARYPIGVAEIELLLHGYNTTFAVTCTDGTRFALRINVSSGRNRANLNAEIAWVTAIKTVDVPRPQRNLDGDFVTTVWHGELGRHLNCVLYSWLNGTIVDDEGDPAVVAEALFATGVAMAKLHNETEGYRLPDGAEFPELRGALWGVESNFVPENEALTAEALAEILPALAEIDAVAERLWGQGVPQVIHADLHKSNTMWDGTRLAVFDFDDAGIGLPIQDLATAVYYTDSDEEEQALRDGYASVRAFPAVSVRDWDTLILQRRLFLLNWLFETTNLEFQAMLPAYLEKSLERVREFKAAHPSG